MTSNNSIANGLITSYSGADRAEVLVMLRQAAAAGRAADRREVLTILETHRKIMREALQSVDSEKRLERLKLIRSIKTIDALTKLL